MLSYLLHCQFVGAIPVGFVIYNDISKDLGGIVTHRISPYKQFGHPQGHRLYVYKDSRSKSHWEFAYEKLPGGDVVIWGMTNIKLIRESDGIDGVLSLMGRVDNLYK